MAGRQEIPRRRYYTRDPVWGSIILTILTWLAVALMALTAPGGWTVEGIVFLVVVTAGLAGALWRMTRWGIHVNDEGVCVVNFFSTVRTIPWEEIREFRLGREAFVGIAAALERKDGTVVWCSAIQHRWLSSIERAQRKAAGRAVAALNSEMRERRCD